MNWVCDLYNFGLHYMFATEAEALAYGKRSGFQFHVYQIETK